MNKLYYTQCVMDGETEYGVTLVAGIKPVDGQDDKFIHRVTKTRMFDTSDAAVTFFNHLKHITKNRPFAAIEQFCGIGGKTSLSSVLKQDKRVRHIVNCPDGTYSVWIGRLKGDKLAREDEKGVTYYNSLGQFVSAHLKEVHPTRRRGDGWKECETKIKGEWVRMRVVRCLVA
jgi:hypothetical protein